MADETNDTLTSGADTTNGATATDTTSGGTENSITGAAADTAGGATAPALADGGFVVIAKPAQILSESDARALAQTTAEANPGTDYVVARIVYDEFEPKPDEQETVYSGA